MTIWNGPVPTVLPVVIEEPVFSIFPVTTVHVFVPVFVPVFIIHVVIDHVLTCPVPVASVLLEKEISKSVLITKIPIAFLFFI